MNTNQVDEGYKEEYDLARKAMLNVHLVDIDNLSNSKIIPALTNSKKIVYRGWMLNQNAYTALETRFGDQLLSSKTDYCNAHYLPNWYDDLKDLSMLSIITNEQNAAEEFKKIPEGRAFVKDFVKSLKTGNGSIVYSSNDVINTIKNMKQYRGIIEGGIILREVIELIPNSEITIFCS